MKDQIKKSVYECSTAIRQLENDVSLTFIEAASALLAKTFVKGGKVILAGNGGSLCDAGHFAEELTGQFRARRRALPAIALNDPGHITCVGNDFGFEEIFARGVEAFGKEGDIFIGLTTSGNSPNILRAFEQAHKQKLHTIAFLGKDGGALKGKANLELVISGFAHSDRIQEVHMAAIHVIIETVETLLFNRNLLTQMAASSCLLDGKKVS